MKKILLVMLMACTLLGISGCSKKEEKTYEYPLSASELLEKIENKETFVVYLAATSCEQCGIYGKFIPKFNEQYDIEIMHVDMEQEKTNDKESHDEVLELFQLQYTPTTYVVIDGEIKEARDGRLNTETLIEYLSKYDLIEVKE